MQSDKLEQCPICKGRGRVNCMLGSLVCGECAGTGYVPEGDTRDDVTKIKDTLRMQRLRDKE